MSLYSKLTLVNKFDFILQFLSKQKQVKIYSDARIKFMKEFDAYTPKLEEIDFSKTCTTLWGINFRAPIYNAAGMFKNGESYQTSYNLGAGAYLLGTTTHNPRHGNTKNNVYLPSVMLHSSKSAINFLGLPNIGDQLILNKIQAYPVLPDFPCGVSLMRSPDYSIMQGLDNMIQSLFEYNDLDLIKFIEINESCPNVNNGDFSKIFERLSYLADKFLKIRHKKKPVILKLSTDYPRVMLPELIEQVIKLGFSGLTLGNTSTDYENCINYLTNKDKELMYYFVNNFGGGLSGKPIAEKSLDLIEAASDLVYHIRPDHEFHLIRTGGVFDAEDIRISLESGASICQWYTGFFHNLSQHGTSVYRNILTDLSNQK